MYGSLIYTFAVTLCGCAIGWFVRDLVWKLRREEVVTEVIKYDTQCKSCNALRRTINEEVQKSHATGSTYHLPIIHLANGSFRVHWEKMGIRPEIGGSKKKR